MNETDELDPAETLLIEAHEEEDCGCEDCPPATTQWSAGRMPFGWSGDWWAGFGIIALIALIAALFFGTIATAYDANRDKAVTHDKACASIEQSAERTLCLQD